MIAKHGQYDRQTHDPRVRAGLKAEEQMQFYLHRAFATSQDLYVLNDLRLENSTVPDSNGKPSVCQIDHLIIHRWGMFIVESKSVTEEILIRPDGSGGDEWSRKYKGREEGMASPIQQAKRQGEILRILLQRSREHLLGKMPTGLGTISKLLHGTDQRGFITLPIQIVISISDSGRINRIGGWTPPEGDFATNVCKADLVVDHIIAEFTRHRQGSSLLRATEGIYGHWSMLATEVPVVASFLINSHTPPHSASPARSMASVSPSPQPIQSRDARRSGTTHLPATPDRPRCKSCSSESLYAASGKYGYYWKCTACQANTTIPQVCDACGTKGRNGDNVRIRKDGPVYWRECANCGISEKVWVEK